MFSRHYDDSSFPFVIRGLFGARKSKRFAREEEKASLQEHDLKCTYSRASGHRRFYLSRRFKATFLTVDLAEIFSCLVRHLDLASAQISDLSRNRSTVGATCSRVHRAIELLRPARR